MMKPLLELSEQLRSDETFFLLNIRFKLMKNPAFLIALSLEIPTDC